VLGVIGAGATATLTIDWHNVWKKFPEAAVTMHEIQRIRDEGQSWPVVGTNDIPNTWPLGFIRLTLWHDAAQLIWCDPTYITAKFNLNVANGLFIGFTFSKSPSTEQGIQNKLFSIFVMLILTIPGA
jgi:ATP-binding cassette subfamily G (WHITE) protein 2 (SNQ2)